MFIDFLDKSKRINIAEADNEGRIDPSANVARLGDWIKKGKGPEYITYEARTENLLLIWDDGHSESEPPELNVIADFIDPDIVHVFMNGVSMAEVKGDPYLTADDITLVPLSAAQIVGLTPC